MELDRDILQIMCFGHPYSTQNYTDQPREVANHESMQTDQEVLQSMSTRHPAATQDHVN